MARILFLVAARIALFAGVDSRKPEMIADGTVGSSLRVIEFPSMAVAKSFEASPKYLKIAPLRQRASRGRVFLVEGSPQPQE